MEPKMKTWWKSSKRQYTRDDRRSGRRSKPRFRPWLEALEERIEPAPVWQFFPVPVPPGSNGGEASDLTAGPDGAVWYTAESLDHDFIGRIAPDGTITQFSVPGAGAANANGALAGGIVTGPDGNLWFIGQISAGQTGLYRMTPQGQFTAFDSPVPDLGDFTWPGDTGHDVLAAGADGNLWFATVGGICRFSTQGQFTVFALPPGIQAGDFVAGSDGNMWFLWANSPTYVFGVPQTEGAGLIKPDGTIQFTNTFSNGNRIDFGPRSMFFVDAPLDCIGSDGNFWALTTLQNPFINQSGGLAVTTVYFLNRVTPAGVLTSFALPPVAAGSDGYHGFTLPGDYDSLVAGPDGNLWLVSDNFGSGNSYVQLTVVNTNGVVLNDYPTPTYLSDDHNYELNRMIGPLIVGGDGNLYTISILPGPSSAIARMQLPVAGPVSQLSLTASSTEISAGSALSITVQALNPTGAVDSNYQGTVHFDTPSNLGTGFQLPADYTFTASDQGVHTFTGIVLDNAGQQSISATDSATGIMGAVDVTVLPGPASAFRLAWIQIPDAPQFPGFLGQVVGLQSTVQATAVDAFGNTVPGYTGTVHFTSSDAAAQLPADYTFMTSDQGVHDFAVVMGTAGPQEVDVTDGTSAGSTGSGNGAILPSITGEWFQYIVGTNNIVAGTPFTLTVKAWDAESLNTNYRGTVHFLSSDPTATLPPDYTFTASDQGVHTFEMTFRMAGRVSWNLEDLAIGPQSINAYPSPFAFPSVAPAPLAKLVLLAPDSPHAGNPFVLSVSAEDQYGNLVPYYDSINFSATDSQAVLPASYQFQAADGGVHTFSGLVLNSVGSQTIEVTDPRFGVSASITLDVLPGPFAAPPAPTINEFALNYEMDTITTASDGAMWGQDGAIEPAGRNYSSDYLVRLTTDGTDSLVPIQGGGIERPVNGPGGNLYVAQYVPLQGPSISIINPLNLAAGPINTNVSGVPQTMGPDGNIWLTPYPSAGAAPTPRIGRMTPQGGVVDFPTGVVSTSDLIPGPDGNIWFVYTVVGGLDGGPQSGGVGIGRITPEGDITLLPMFAARSISNLAFDAAGNLWFVTNPGRFTPANGLSNNPLVLNRIAPDGTLTTFPYPAPGFAGPPVLITAPDGNVWTCIGVYNPFQPDVPGPTALLRISSDGAITSYAMPSLVSAGAYTTTFTDATVGPDGNLWFTGYVFPLGGGVNSYFAAEVVLPSEGPPASLAVSTVDTTKTAGSTFAVTVRALDANTMQVVGYRGTVHFSSSDQQAGLPADYTFTSADQGVHTFIGILLDTAGTDSITASDGTSQISGATSLQVQPGPAARLLMSTVPAIDAYHSFQVTVSVADAFGNPIPSYTGVVHFSSPDISAILPGDYTFTSADLGVHTFSVTLGTPGTESLTVSGNGGQQSGNMSITVDPGVASYRINAPSTITAGQPFSVTISVIDGSSNVLTGYRGIIHFASADQQAGLPANYQFTAADLGVHTFTGVFLGTAGPQQITLADPNNNTLSGTDAIDVTPANLAALVTTGSTNAIAGTPFSLTVAAYDRFRNPVTSYAGTINITTGDPKGIVPGLYHFQASDQGVHTFTGIVLKTAGLETVTVTDSGAVVSNQTSVQVTAAAASRYILNVPAHAQVGTAISIAITAFDPYGNKATAYAGTLHFTSTDLHAGVPADYTFAATDQGSHTFMVIFHAVGNQSLSVSDVNNSALLGTSTKTLVTANDWVTGADAGGGPEVKLFDATTGKAKLDFMAYSPYFLGGVRVALGDIYNTGIPDIITVPGPTGGPDVRIFDGRTGQKVFEFMAFDPRFAGGLFVTVADFNGDGYADIAIGADAGGGPQVKIFSGKGIASGSLQVLASFYAYSPYFNGGVRLASADINGDGTPDLITAPGPGGGPDVRVFDGAHLNQANYHTDIIREFMAYSPYFNGGVYVAAGDVNGDGKTDIITGAGAGGGPQVSVFSGVDLKLLEAFMAYSPYFNGGVLVGYALDQDGHGDILTAAGTGGGPHVRVLDGMSLSELDGFFAYTPAFDGGVFIGGE
jgi:streptogramin lyase